jgi:hypothetical protein
LRGHSEGQVIRVTAKGTASEEPGGAVRTLPTALNEARS